MAEPEPESPADEVREASAVEPLLSCELLRDLGASVVDTFNACTKPQVARSTEADVSSSTSDAGTGAYGGGAAR